MTVKRARYAFPVDCPDCGAPIVFSMCGPSGNRPLSEKAREAIREVIVGAHKQLGGCHPKPIEGTC